MRILSASLNAFHGVTLWQTFISEDNSLSLQKRVQKYNPAKGALAHLARARHWQCRGDRFESDTLHKGEVQLIS